MLYFPLAQLVTAWVLMGVVGYYAFHVNRNAAFKRKWWPCYLLLSNGLFLYLFWTMGFRGPALWMMGGSVLFSYLSLSRVRFCNACGRTVMVREAFGATLAYCPYCGTRLVN
jgi:hypothetical protein